MLSQTEWCWRPPANHTVAQQLGGTGGQQGPPAILIHPVQVRPHLLAAEIPLALPYSSPSNTFPLGSPHLFHRDKCAEIFPRVVKLSKALAVCWEELPSAAGIQVSSFMAKKNPPKTPKITHFHCQTLGLAVGFGHSPLASSLHISEVPSPDLYCDCRTPVCYSWYHGKREKCQAINPSIIWGSI